MLGSVSRVKIILCLECLFCGNEIESGIELCQKNNANAY